MYSSSDDDDDDDNEGEDEDDDKEEEEGGGGLYELAFFMSPVFKYEKKTWSDGRA